MSKSVKIKISKKEFHKWLLSKPMYEIVGITQEPQTCPVARFIKQKYHCSRKSIHISRAVSYFRLKIDNKIIHYDILLAPWLQNFLRIIDNYKYPQKITAAHAYVAFKEAIND